MGTVYEYSIDFENGIYGRQNIYIQALTLTQALEFVGISINDVISVTREALI